MNQTQISEDIQLIRDMIEKTSGATTYAQNAIAHLTFACGIAFGLAGFVFPILKLYTYREIPVVISMIVGILLFVIGGIKESRADES